ncbi:unnamed protein product [Caenorhabditis angaria]|uniref:Uncharacterized protein n=1 Tax=Caenorhabditis angaria TaxID=860376 RepID=A0A9P1N5F9_9PELO|nr:unnamed protein product [Caenorhabditis angaria]
MSKFSGEKSLATFVAEFTRFHKSPDFKSACPPPLPPKRKCSEQCSAQRKSSTNSNAEVFRKHSTIITVGAEVLQTSEKSRR